MIRQNFALIEKENQVISPIPMKTYLQYGKDGLEVEIPSEHITVLTPKFVAGLPDEAASFREAVREPIGGRPLRELIRATDRVAVVIPDEVRRAHIEPVTDITARISEELTRIGKDAPVAVLPEGPMTIPYLNP